MSITLKLIIVTCITLQTCVSGGSVDRDEFVETCKKCLKETSANPRDVFNIIVTRSQKTDELTSSFFKCLLIYYGIADDRCNIDTDVSQVIFSDFIGLTEKAAKEVLKDCWTLKGPTVTQSCGSSMQCVLSRERAGAAEEMMAGLRDLF